MYSTHTGGVCHDWTSGWRAGRSWRLLLREIERGGVGWRATQYVVAMDLTAYLDESGIHSGASHCALAGFIASPRQWRLFDVAWHKALSVAPDLPVFHASDFFGRSGPYRSLPDATRLELILGLCNAVTSHRLTPFGIIVDCEVFNRLSRDARRFITGGTILLDQSSRKWKWESSGAPNRPYFAVLNTALMLAANLAKPGKTVDFVFDQQETFAPLVLSEFAKTKALALVDGSEKLGNCTFMDRKQTSALQAADLLAHCWCTCYSAIIAGKEAFDKRGQLAQIAATERGKTLGEITRGNWWRDFSFQWFESEEALVLPIRRLSEDVARFLLEDRVEEP